MHLFNIVLKASNHTQQAKFVRFDLIKVTPDDIRHTLAKGLLLCCKVFSAVAFYYAYFFVTRFSLHFLCSNSGETIDPTRLIGTIRLQ